MIIEYLVRSDRYLPLSEVEYVGIELYKDIMENSGQLVLEGETLDVVDDGGFVKLLFMEPNNTQVEGKSDWGREHRNVVVRRGVVVSGGEWVRWQ